ncbi:MAG TPA: sulfotransferase [Thermoanaerobaculia bacterium]|nr:sulfotransferase [Thermoanaerobaculia bacterium]
MPFVVGVARSGTTLLRLMLDAHPELAIPHETHFIPAVLREPQAGRESFFRRLTEFPTWQDLKTPADRFWEELCRVEPFDVQGGLRAFYRLYAGLRGKSRWGDKSPPYCLHIRTIHDGLPEARFIHILRDGRDVALSLRHLWFSPGTDMEALATQWVQHITLARQQGQGNPFYLEVRYEDLVRNPVRELQRICGFAGLEYEPGMERYHETARFRLEEVETRHDADGRVVITKDERLRLHRFTSLPPQSSRIGRWRTEMTREMLAAYEEIAGDLLADLGYERGSRRKRRRWFSRWFS